MARGYPGAFGRKVNALYMWLPLCLLFLVPFVDPRRPFRLLHLDLLVLLGFSVSLAFFNHGNIGVSVPLAYPPLRLPARAHAMVGPGAAARTARAAAPARPGAWLAVALVFLLGFRSALNVIELQRDRRRLRGRHRRRPARRRERLYGDFPADNQHGDTYGPVNYYAYVPFEQALPWSGTLGRPARGARRGDLLRRCSPRCCCGCWAGGSAGRRWGSRWPTRGPPSPSPCSR